MTNKLSVACAAITFMVLSSAPQAAPQKEAARSAAEAGAQRALIDQYRSGMAVTMNLIPRRALPMPLAKPGGLTTSTSHSS